MAQIHHSGVITVGSTVAFSYLDDYRHVPTWMFGVTQFDPAGDAVRGLGARFRTAMQLGPKTLRSVVQITEWQEDRLLTLESVDGFANSSRWEFEPIDHNETQLTVDFRYELPGGLAGRALGRLIEPFVDQAIRHTERTLRGRIEDLDPV